MGRLLAPAVALAMGLLGCTRPPGSTGDAPPASSASADLSAAVPDLPPSAPPALTRVLPDSPAAPRPAPGALVVGNGCSPGRDSIACTSDGLGVLTCASGQWRMLESCRGPGKCVGVGSALTCDTGSPQPGDACVPSKSETHCRSATEAISCVNGKWMVSPCGAGTLCSLGSAKGHAGCK